MSRRLHHYLVRLVVPLVLTAMLLPVFLFLLQGDALPCTHDNIFHSYRIVAMREMLRHGWLFSRWVPNLALGYGYPFFTYREPVPYLVGEGLFVLGIPLPLVLGGLYAVSLLAGAWGAYVLARAHFSSRAAWVSAVAYGLAPYVLMDVLRRGNLPESVGLALVPWIFVAMRRLILRKGRGRLVTVVLLLSGLFLSHNISSLLLAPFLGLYVVFLAFEYRERGGWPYGFAAVVIAVLLTAWFWLPALTEQGLVQLNLSRSTRNNDFHYNFVTWREMLFTLPAPYDPAYVNPPMRVSLGVGRVVLALLGSGLGLWRARDGRTRRLIVLFVMMAAIYLWMATPSSLGIWESVPLLAFVQFPWRFVGRALLPASLLAGLVVESWPRRGRAPLDRTEAWGRRRAWLFDLATVACVAALALLSWPETYPPKGMCGAGRYPDLRALYARERDGWMGMDPESSYFPVWVEEHPSDTDLADAFQRGELPQRFDDTQLPPGGEILASTYHPLRARLTVETPEDFRARWLGFYYPGWRVEIDGRRVDVAPEDDTGLIRFDVPAGVHEIRVAFGLTPPRLVGTGLAFAGLVGLVGILFVPGLQAGIASSSVHPAGRGSGRIDVAGAMLGLSVGLLVLRYGVVGRVPTPWMRSRLAKGELPEVSVALDQPYEGAMRLLGQSVSPDRLVGDGELTVSLLWLAERQPSRDYQTTVLLRGQDGQIWSPAGTLRPRGYEPPPSSASWEAGAYVYDPHIVIPDPGTPPGSYEVVVALFDEDTLVPLSPLDADGRPLGPDLTLTTIELLPPSQPPSLEAFRISPVDPPQSCGPLRLMGFSVDREIGVPGDLLAVRWVWEAAQTPTVDLVANFLLEGPDGDTIQRWQLPPAAGWWPTDRWTADERWAGEQVVRLPGDLDSGPHRVRVGLTACDESLATAPLDVIAPKRAWDVPDDLLRDQVVFGDQLALVGHALAPEAPSAGDRVELTLAWQAESLMMTSYRIFVHLVGPDGVLVDQDDGEPADWSRPTTGWAVGEVVVEERSVTIPAAPDAGPYVLRVGVYAPDGTRLSTGEGASDGYVLATLDLD